VQRGSALTARFCTAYDSDPGAYVSGQAKFSFDASIYGHASVKTDLRAAQHDKCCFCESKVSHISYGDVEHFRPKAGFSQKPRGPLQKPGYYWLAYQWSNLLFCCQVCNQRQKRNHFPLRRSRRRAVTYHDNLAKEEPLFLDPATDDPTRYVRFREEYLYPVNNSRRGKTTIEALGLNRPTLVERRRDYVTILRRLKECRDLFRRAIAEAQSSGANLPTGFREQLEKIELNFKHLQDDAAEYAAMARAALD
jgi:uncharacterized protein (TIGR02646 family)